MHDEYALCNIACTEAASKAWRSTCEETRHQEKGAEASLTNSGPGLAGGMLGGAREQKGTCARPGKPRRMTQGCIPLASNPFRYPRRRRAGRGAPARRTPPRRRASPGARRSGTAPAPCPGGGSARCACTRAAPGNGANLRHANLWKLRFAHPGPLLMNALKHASQVSMLHTVFAGLVNLASSTNHALASARAWKGAHNSQ